MKTPTIFFSLIILAAAYALCAQPADTSKIKPSYHEVNAFVDDNENCLRCHGELKYTLEDQGRVRTEHMCPDRILDRDAFYTGVHRAFACLDCHSYEFEVFPHSLEGRLTEMMMCMDCHGYDESYAQYHFEDIEKEFTESIHHIDEFTCWKCHDPHSYRAFMRNADDLEEAILYDNNMCLNCHANFTQFMVLTERSEINVIDSHDWLPNQASHFAHVRCIECHTEINDSILVAHKILPKTGAARLCTECHSTDSRLMHTLYKFQSKEDRKAGFVNGVIVNNAFVIGANKNPLLNKLSFLILAATLAGICFHIFLRIKNQKSR